MFSAHLSHFPSQNHPTNVPYSFTELSLTVQNLSICQCREMPHSKTAREGAVCHERGFLFCCPFQIHTRAEETVKLNISRAMASPQLCCALQHMWSSLKHYYGELYLAFQKLQ